MSTTAHPAGDEAVAQGWFGPVAEDRVRARIGDVVVAARTDFAIVRSAVRSRLAPVIGHHGSLTPAEQLVPLLVFSPDASGEHRSAARRASTPTVLF